MLFEDRAKAGKLLAKALEKYQGQDVVVYALPRGGVVTALEIAKFLKAPLDLIIARKIGHPAQPEYAIAAITETGEMVGNPEELKSVDQQWFADEIKKQRLEAKRRRELYLQDKKELPVKNKIAIIVDDGIATGLTMRAGVAELQKRHPQKIVVAVPVTPKSTAELLQQKNEVVALDIPNDENYLGAVGSYYNDFPQVEDEEVITLLKSLKTNADPLLFAFPSYDLLTKALIKNPNIKSAEFIEKEFPNGELHLKLLASPSGQECLIIGTITPPENNLFSLLMLVHTLKKEGAKKISVLLPYLAYSRHDKNEKLKSYNTELIGSLFKATGIDILITLDIHSPQAIKLLSLPIISLSPAKLFAEEIKKLNLKDLTLIAPDEGAKTRTNAVAQELGIENKIAYFEKTRTNMGITHAKLHGKINKKIVIIDDMLDTGGTLISACQKLKENGAEEIYIMVTHGLFTGDEWKKLWSLDVKRIYCTDTIPLSEKNKQQNISVLSVIPLITNYLQT